MTPYWRLFLGALDDFMLRFLLVCAVIELSIEVGFADHEERNTGKYYDLYSLNSPNWVNAPILYMSNGGIERAPSLFYEDDI
jgi:hypothetical protein